MDVVNLSLSLSLSSTSLASEDGSVVMPMAHGTGYGTKVIKSITSTTRRHQRDSMTITVKFKEGFGCEDHHGQPNACLHHGEAEH